MKINLEYFDLDKKISVVGEAKRLTQLLDSNIS
jgi:hypothetical protein